MRYLVSSFKSDTYYILWFTYGDVRELDLADEHGGRLDHGQEHWVEELENNHQMKLVFFRIKRK